MRTERTRTLRRLACAALFTALLGGCSHAVEFEVTPPVFSDCDGPNVVAHVRWDARAVTKADVRIFIYKIGNPPVLWAQEAAHGAKDTGKWVTDGSTFLLKTGDGKLLAERTIETTACPRPAKPLAHKHG